MLKNQSTVLKVCHKTVINSRVFLQWNARLFRIIIELENHSGFLLNFVPFHTVRSDLYEA